MTLKFNKLLKTFQTDQSAVSLLGWCEHFARITRWEGEDHKCSHVDVVSLLKDSKWTPPKIRQPTIHLLSEKVI